MKNSIKRISKSNKFSNYFLKYSSALVSQVGMVQGVNLQVI